MLLQVIIVSYVLCLMFSLPVKMGVSLCHLAWREGHRGRKIAQEKTIVPYFGSRDSIAQIAAKWRYRLCSHYENAKNQGVWDTSYLISGEENVISEGGQSNSS